MFKIEIPSTAFDRIAQYAANYEGREWHACSEAEKDRYRSFVLALEPAFVRVIATAINKTSKELFAPTDTAIFDIAAERLRQVEAEGFTADRDDGYKGGALADAAACYARYAGSMLSPVPEEWPWARSWWKPKTRREDLVRAGALIAAEIDRLDRLAAASAQWGDDRKREEPAA